MKKDYMSDASVTIHEPCNIYGKPLLRRNVSIGAFTEIGPAVEIGVGTRVQGGCFIPQGVTIGSDCFIGPHVCFTNVKEPMSGNRVDPDAYERTTVCDNVVIGAGAVILPGIRLGERCFIAAGAVVTKDVKPGQKVAGNPAKPMK
ncbi:MAG: acyltransferase [Planctomycetota bacterium]|jgi:UDP-2-acetamido-3-amino-2,3-dideoxy-glucuronate N-acetyltransferase